MVKAAVVVMALATEEVDEVTVEVVKVAKVPEEAAATAVAVKVADSEMDKVAMATKTVKMVLEGLVVASKVAP